MKTNAKQIRPLNGTSLIVVLGFLFMTALPQISMEAGNKGASDNHSLMNSSKCELYAPEQSVVIEPWMLTLTDWNTSPLAARAEEGLIVEAWMLTPEYWDIDYQFELAETVYSDQEFLEGWMFEPTSWSRDSASLEYGVADYDLGMLPLYF